MKVIVVEDEIRIREGICKLIQETENDWEVVGQAENGCEGLKLILQLEPDLIITDIRMPIMDGLEMLREAYRNKCRGKAIVLSAFSEFAYAQQAIKLGVSEYLLKPIMIHDILSAFRNIESQYEQDRRGNPEAIRSLEQIYMGIIYGGLKLDAGLKDYLESKYLFSEGTMFTEILVCLEEQYETSVEKAKRALRVVLKEKENLEYTMLEVPKEKALMIIIHDYKKVEELERWFQNRVILGKSIDVPISFGWTNVIGLGQLKNGIQILMKYMDWNIVLGEHVMISYPKIMQIQTVPCIYPIEIENKIKVSLCANQLSETQNLILNFNESFHDGKVYTPKEIKECYIRFIWSMINVAKEIGNIDSEYLEQRSILESIINAKDSRTLAAIINQIYSKIIFVTGEKGEITNLVVRRAQSLIHEFYQTGITLEEIASKLNITPEYLSSQFHKETGVLFSGYIKNYRINKAKELLISTTLKQYDVANQVGYGDPKYFGRVFRECTGLRPLDYRNLQR